MGSTGRDRKQSLLRWRSRMVMVMVMVMVRYPAVSCPHPSVLASSLWLSCVLVRLAPFFDGFSFLVSVCPGFFMEICLYVLLPPAGRVTIRPIPSNPIPSHAVPAPPRLAPAPTPYRVIPHTRSLASTGPAQDGSRGEREENPTGADREGGAGRLCPSLRLQPLHCVSGSLCLVLMSWSASECGARDRRRTSACPASGLDDCVGSFVDGLICTAVTCLVIAERQAHCMFVCLQAFSFTFAAIAVVRQLHCIALHEAKRTASSVWD